MSPLSLNRAYSLLFKQYGAQGWWPGKTDFEICIGAILTQNVSWKNVETAIKKLKSNALLSPRKLLSTPDGILSELIRSTGYYNQKVIKVKNFLEWFKKYKFSFALLKKYDLGFLRGELLSVKGIGEETADSILLYSLLKKIFVIDAYTKRIYYRLGILTGKEKYGEIQAMFHKKFKGGVQDYNEYHALIVNHGKNVCKKNALCRDCCLESCCIKRL